MGRMPAAPAIACVREPPPMSRRRSVGYRDQRTGAWGGRFNRRLKENVDPSPGVPGSALRRQPRDARE
jgi:hypothetical protein